jgi:hypothetical protein
MRVPVAPMLDLRRKQGRGSHRDRRFDRGCG